MLQFCLTTSIYDDCIITKDYKRIETQKITYSISNDKLYIFEKSKLIIKFDIPHNEKYEIIEFMQKYYKEKIPDNIENQN